MGEANLNVALPPKELPVNSEHGFNPDKPFNAVFFIERFIEAQLKGRSTRLH